jgi:hypothetical protein
MVTSVTCGHPISKPAVRLFCSRPTLAQAPRVHRRPERQPFALAKKQMPKRQLHRSTRTGSPNPATHRVVPSPIHSALRETNTSFGESCVYPQPSNDEVERHGVAPPSNEADLSPSSIPSLAHRRRDPRSLEPIVGCQDLFPWLNGPWYWREQRMAQRHTHCAPLPTQHRTSDG